MPAPMVADETGRARVPVGRLHGTIGEVEEAPMVQVLQSRVLLRPRHFERSLQFYEGQLGLVRYREWGEPPHRGVVFFLGGGYLELGESGAGEAPHGARLWLQVADLDAAVTELRAAGVTIDEPAEHKPWGLLEAVVRDPDGLRLVLVETPVTHPLRRRQG